MGKGWRYTKWLAVHAGVDTSKTSKRERESAFRAAPATVSKRGKKAFLLTITVTATGDTRIA
jgi:hypothetical protein